MVKVVGDGGVECGGDDGWYRWVVQVDGEGDEGGW